ncbi:MAG: alpha/beta hydrolase [Acidobacteriaceae bacterium]|jgi:pimeloyl-ACP methyl ester carboxylesterase
MPSPTPRPARNPRQKPPIRPHLPAPAQAVHPLWLAKALAITLLATLLCAWLTLCLLFYQGDWQLILHPSRTVAQTPAVLNLPFQTIRFDASETGQPRLTAWDLPAGPGGPYAAYTVLYLHDGSGSLADTLPTLALLHRAGLNLFAIDYRGFGLSDLSAHPTQARMAEDAAAALAYLTSTLHVPPSRILPYGYGLGASLAVTLAHDHPELPAIILANPDPDPTATALAAYSSNFIPVRLLFRQRFEITAPLSTVPTPKLLIAGGPAAASAPASATSPNRLHALQILFQQAASPCFSITLPLANYDAPYTAALTRFLDQYLPK